MDDLLQAMNNVGVENIEAVCICYVLKFKYYIFNIGKNLMYKYYITFLIISYKIFRFYTTLQGKHALWQKEKCTNWKKRWSCISLIYVFGSVISLDFGLLYIYIYIYIEGRVLVRTMLKCELCEPCYILAKSCYYFFPWLLCLKTNTFLPNRNSFQKCYCYIKTITFQP